MGRPVHLIRRVAATWAFFNFALLSYSEAAWVLDLTAGTPGVCKATNTNLDQAWSAFHKTHAPCELRTDVQTMLKGYLLRCGGNYNQVLFTSQQQCQLVQKQGQGTSAPPEAFVPPGRKNPKQWAESFEGCMKGASKFIAKAVKGLQAANDFCVCISDRGTAAQAECMKLHPPPKI